MAMKVFLILAVALLVAYVARSAPATEGYKLCSHNAGKCVHVYENGTISANSVYKKASAFTMYLKNDRVQFELEPSTRMFLMLKVSNTTSLPMNVTANQTIVHEYVLVVDYLSESYLTQWEKSTTTGALFQKVDENTTCAISFDRSGKVAGPCNLSALDTIDTY